MQNDTKKSTDHKPGSFEGKMISITFTGCLCAVIIVLVAKALVWIW